MAKEDFPSPKIAVLEHIEVPLLNDITFRGVHKSRPFANGKRKRGRMIQRVFGIHGSTETKDRYLEIVCI